MIKGKSINKGGGEQRGKRQTRVRGKETEQRGHLRRGGGGKKEKGGPRGGDSWGERGGGLRREGRGSMASRRRGFESEEGKRRRVSIEFWG